MEKDNLPCTEISERDSACCESKTLKIFDKFQALYEDQLSEIDESSVDSLQLKVKLLQDWVADLTEQNVTLVKTVEELEQEALNRVALLESHMPQKKDPHDPCLTTTLSSQESSIAQLTAELEHVKKQLSYKECLLKSYLKRIEDLRQNAEKASKQMKHCSSMTEEMWFSKSDQQSELHAESNKVELHLNETQKETTDLKCKLLEAEENVQKLNHDLITSKENAKDMRTALTAEVAEKHDIIRSLKREIVHLEEQVKQANMQTHFKDDIIKELRKEMKVARSKLWFLGPGSDHISPFVVVHRSDESMLNTGKSCILELYQKPAFQIDNSKAIIEISKKPTLLASYVSQHTVPSKPYENSCEKISEKSQKKQRSKLTVKNNLQSNSEPTRFVRFEKTLPEKVDFNSMYMMENCPVHGRIAGPT